MFGNGRECLPDVREWSGDPLGCLSVVRRPSWVSGSGREDLTVIRERSRVPPGITGMVGRAPACPGVVGRPSEICGSG